MSRIRNTIGIKLILMVNFMHVLIELANCETVITGIFPGSKTRGNQVFSAKWSSSRTKPQTNGT